MTPFVKVLAGSTLMLPEIATDLLQGGLQGGQIRSQKLSAERRKEIAEKAIAARWAKRDKAREIS